jgi:hypothetical protein
MVVVIQTRIHHPQVWKEEELDKRRLIRVCSLNWKKQHLTLARKVVV